jgi:galactose mutarotase-like enzyme
LGERFAISSGELSAAIDPLGAELVSLTDAAGRQYLWSGDPAWWTGQAPILFPIIGELAGGTYRLGEQSYPLARHGFARRSTFACEEHEPGGWARFRLKDSEATRAVYPFPFLLELLYAVQGRTLTITATVINRGDQPMPFSLGFHPAFAWPLPGGGNRGAHSIVFEQPEPATIRRLDADGSSPARSRLR